MAAKKAKSTGAPVAKTSSPLPSYIKVKGGKYDITKTATGKIKVTNQTGGTVTFPKGTNINAIASRLQSGERMAQAAAKVKGAKISVPGKTTIKVRGGSAGRGGGAGLGGMFSTKNR